MQVLREQQFDANCLQRRSVPEDRRSYSAHEVALWTNHRVMEWLRAVDLAEYAPNMRGSGECHFYLMLSSHVLNLFTVHTRHNNLISCF